MRPVICGCKRKLKWCELADHQATVCPHVEVDCPLFAEYQTCAGNCSLETVVDISRRLEAVALKCQTSLLLLDSLLFHWLMKLESHESMKLLT
eukprot:gene21768-27824_t